MFLHLSVSYCVHRGGGVCLSACWDIPTGQAPRPWADTPPCRRLLQRTVRILLECILVLIFFRPHRGRGLCMSLPFCLWSHVPSRGSLSLVPCSFWGCFCPGHLCQGDPPDRDPCPMKSGQYASYCNAFLCLFGFDLCQFCFLRGGGYVSSENHQVSLARGMSRGYGGMSRGVYQGTWDTQPTSTDT